MSKARSMRSNARRLSEQAGTIPAAFVAALAGVIPGAALAQPSDGSGVKISSPDRPVSGQPGGVRDPMKPGQPKEGDKAKVKVSDQMTVDLHVKDENIANVLELLAIQSQKNIIASKNVTGKISADLYNVTFDEALDAILHVNGFGWIQQGNFIYVYTAEELEKIRKALSKRAAKVIRLNYLNAVDAAEFVKPMLSQGGEIKTSNKTEAFNIPDSTPTGKDDYALGATLVVVDYEENINAIEKLLVELDTKPAQVLVEATVLQTKLTESNAFGVDFSIIGDLNFNEFAGLAGALAGPLGIVNAIRAGGGSSPPASLADNNGVGVVGTTGKTDGPSTLKVGVISDNIAVIVKFLDTVGDTAVLANPKLLTLNRQPARVLVGQRLGYISSTATETSTTQTVQFLDTGVQLYFRPFVAASGDIRMELKPQVSSATTTPYQTSAGTVIVPDEDTQEVVTNVIVKDGMTIVIGGLFKEEVKANRSQVPFLGDIPVIGTAFRGNDDSTTRDEIIFLITPSVVNDNVLLSQGEDARNVIDRVRAGHRQGLLPWSRDRMTSQLNVEAERYWREGDQRKAAWTLSRSLSLNPRQPEALRLRERWTGERELWPSGQHFDWLLSSEINDRHRAIQPPAQPPAYMPTPYLSWPFPMDPLRPEPVKPVPSGDPWQRLHPMGPAMPAMPSGDGAKPSSMAPTTNPSTDNFGNNPAPAPGTADNTAGGQNDFFAGTMTPAAPSTGNDNNNFANNGNNFNNNEPANGTPGAMGDNPSNPADPANPPANSPAANAGNPDNGDNGNKFMDDSMTNAGFNSGSNGFAAGKPIGGGDAAPMGAVPTGEQASNQAQPAPPAAASPRFVVVPFFHGFWIVPAPAAAPAPVANVPTESSNPESK